jgi:hypothetical protein
MYKVGLNVWEDKTTKRRIYCGASVFRPDSVKVLGRVNVGPRDWRCYIRKIGDRIAKSVEKGLNIGALVFFFVSECTCEMKRHVMLDITRRLH